MKAFYISDIKFNSTTKKQLIDIPNAVPMTITSLGKYKEYSKTRINFGVKTNDLEKKIYVTITNGIENRVDNSSVFEKYDTDIYTRADGISILSTRKDIYKALHAQTKTVPTVNKEIICNMKNYKLEDIIVKKNLDATGVWFAGSGMRKLGLKAEAIFSDSITSNEDYIRNLRIGGTISSVNFKKLINDKTYSLGITDIGGIILHTVPESLDQQLEVVEFVYDNILK